MSPPDANPNNRRFEMKLSEIAQSIDSTALSPQLTEPEVVALVRQAEELNFYSVCVAPCRVPIARRLLNGRSVKVVTVIGFPHGNDLTSSKAQAARAAVSEGADEVDMVMNLGWAQEDAWKKVEQDISRVVQAIPSIPVKVILETCLWPEEKIRLACQAAVTAGAKFVKTSTGYFQGGATVEAVRWMKSSIPASVEVKASGGIRDLATAKAMLAAGATRLGTSAGAAILAGKTNQQDY
jgi:deoxyribose-phosphate aldolase